MKESTLLRRLNNGEDPNTVAREELPKWDKVTIGKDKNGEKIKKVLNGLVKRR